MYSVDEVGRSTMDKKTRARYLGSVSHFVEQTPNA
jgi:hypothetical protein